MVYVVVNVASNVAVNIAGDVADDVGVDIGVDVGVDVRINVGVDVVASVGVMLMVGREKLVVGALRDEVRDGVLERTRVPVCGVVVIVAVAVTVDAVVAW